ncbi:MAG: hypothetical protein HOP14_07935 [Acidobacteria bacterium]|nr:hypothetical protein [Acidobacteriota bacterium]
MDRRTLARWPARWRDVPIGGHMDSGVSLLAIPAGLLFIVLVVMALFLTA